MPWGVGVGYGVRETSVSGVGVRTGGQASKCTRVHSPSGSGELEHTFVHLIFGSRLAPEPGCLNTSHVTPGS